MKSMKTFLAALGVVGAGLLPLSAHATDYVTGAGASFPYPVYTLWAQDYHAATDNQINYQSIGSSAGRRQIIAGNVDFGASDAPFDVASLQKFHLFQFPAVAGGIVPVVHLDGIKSNELVLNGQVLADIFEGKITRWNDPQIVALNPSLKDRLPNANIVVVHRSDGSGTTYNFTNYLSLVSASWQKDIGFNTSVNWPVGQGGKGNEGVAALVKSLDNSIGYVEYAYVQEGHLTATRLVNKDGKVVEASNESVAQAAANADWSLAVPSLMNQGGAQTWPIATATYILVPVVSKNPHQTQAALQFYAWSWKYDAKRAEQLGYAPLPQSVAAGIEAKWHQVLKTSDGQSLCSSDVACTGTYPAAPK